MSDLIDRHDAIKILTSMMRDCFPEAEEELDAVVTTVREIPSAEPEPEEFEWCHDCKEYDQDKHCCHRWTKVIRQTVEDMKNRWKWIPVTEALPEEKGEYLVSYHPCHWNTVSEKVVVGIDTFRGKTTWAKMKYQKVIAWMPLPEAWRGEDGKA